MGGSIGFLESAVIKSLNRVEISLSSLVHNFSLLKKKGGDAAVLAMVKAVGYGHGMVECAKTLAAAGSDCFGVAEVGEGVKLRNAGISNPVVIMAGILPETIPTLLAYRLTPAVVDGSCLELLSKEAMKEGKQIVLHLKVDAGMGRQGCNLSSVSALVQEIQRMPGLSLGGILAHFPMADDPDSPSTAEISAAFSREVDKVRDLMPDDLLIHLANSGGILYFPFTHRDMIRPGISLYGYYPDGEKGRENAVEPLLQPVMRFSSRIIQVKEVPAGTGLGYGHIFTTKRKTRLAIIPVGYEDGYLRCLSTRAQGLVHGCRVPVVGRISMNLTMFDVTDVDGVSPGDEVVLMGHQGNEEISADEIAAWMDTISYEVLCLFGNLNNRVYVEE